MSGIQLPIPTCAICRRPVDRMTSWRDIRTDDFIVQAHCHGEVETTRIEARLLHSFNPRGLEVKAGLAFVPAASSLPCK